MLKFLTSKFNIVVIFLPGILLLIYNFKCHGAPIHADASQVWGQNVLSFNEDGSINLRPIVINS